MILKSADYAEAQRALIGPSGIEMNLLVGRAHDGPAL